MSDSSVVAVGIDVGSCLSRVAVCSSSENNARVVANTLGHRATVSMTALEAQDQKQQQYVHGEAALRLLQKQGKPTTSMRELLLETSNDEECLVFLQHLGSLATDATTSSPQDLRVVLSVPMDASKEYIHSIKKATEAGIKKSIADKRQRKHYHHVVVGIVYDAVAVCMAHGLLDGNTECYENILVIDAGASGLNVSHLKTNGTSEILSLAKHKRLAQVSGPALVTLLSKHVATQFEKRNKIPPGEVWESKRARFKLLHACEDALTSLKSASIHITIDGLYEGMDCHLPLSKPRWEMLTVPLLKQAQAFLDEFSSIKPDAVLLAGSGASFLQASVTKKFPDAFRGISSIAPEEAVVLGCALHAASCVQHEKVKLTTPIHDNIVTSPIEIGIGSDENNVETIIGVGTPLPAHVVYSLSLPQEENVAIWQTQPSWKRLANLVKLPKNQDTVEVVLELSIEGKLSVAIQGGPITII